MWRLSVGFAVALPPRPRPRPKNRIRANAELGSVGYGTITDRAAGWRVPRLELCAPLADLGRRQLYKYHIAIVIDFPSTDQAQEGVKIRTELAGPLLGNAHVYVSPSVNKPTECKPAQTQ